MFKKLKVKKRTSKEATEQELLLGLIELYLRSKSPIGSNTLKNFGFESMSSATIRNYFASLEEKGFLNRQHTSGGRIPTAKAMKLYSEEILKKDFSNKNKKDFFDYFSEKIKFDNKKITTYLSNAIDFLSENLNLSIFLSSPRFDQDFVNDIKLVILDKTRILTVIITDFGLIKTEVITTNQNLDAQKIKLIEDFILWRMNKKIRPTIEDPSLVKLSQQIYNEMMVRYIVGYSNYISEDIYKTGLSKLLSYDYLKDPMLLSEALSIFENTNQMSAILKDAIYKKSITCNIAQDLEKFGYKTGNMCIISIPYYISNIAVGAISILAPLHVDYRKVFSKLFTFSQILSGNLTNNIYKHKITFRQTSDYKKINDSSILLDNKSVK